MKLRFRGQKVRNSWCKMQIPRGLVVVLRFLVACLLLSLVSLDPKSFAETRVSDGNAVTIKRVLVEIQKGLTRAQTEIFALGMPPLESVTLTLQTEYTRSVEGGINLYIFTFGQKWEQGRSQVVELKLVPPPADTPRELASKPGLSEHLVQAIVSAAKGVQKARITDPPLEVEQLKAEFTFVVMTKTKGGLEFEIVPVGAEIKGSLENKALQKITVTFRKETK